MIVVVETRVVRSPAVTSTVVRSVGIPQIRNVPMTFVSATAVMTIPSTALGLIAPDSNHSATTLIP